MTRTAVRGFNCGNTQEPLDKTDLKWRRVAALRTGRTRVESRPCVRTVSVAHSRRGKPVRARRDQISVLKFDIPEVPATQVSKGGGPPWSDGVRTSRGVRAAEQT